MIKQAAAAEPTSAPSIRSDAADSLAIQRASLEIKTSVYVIIAFSGQVSLRQVELQVVELC